MESRKKVRLRIERLEARLAPSCVDPMPSHMDNEVLRAEHEAIFKLVPCAAVTDEAIASGLWNNPATWGSGVPAAEDNVYIPPEFTIVLTSVENAALRTLRIDGSLIFAPQSNTRLL